MRLALGSVAATPVRAPRTEAVLEGASPTAETADMRRTALRDEIQPIDDVRSTADYRREVAGPRPASAHPRRRRLVTSPLLDPTPDDVHVFPTAADFRAWLEANHDTATELWVGYYKKGVPKPSMTYAQSVESALLRLDRRADTAHRRRGHLQPLHAAPQGQQLECHQHRQGGRAEGGRPAASGRAARLRGA